MRHCNEDEDVFIIVGASFYAQAMKYADRLLLTEIEDTPQEADVFFPDYSDWTLVNRESHSKDAKHQFEFSFSDYERILENNPATGSIDNEYHLSPDCL